MADACEIAALHEAGLEHADVVVAATGDDKANLVVSLLAKTEFGVPRTVARVNNPKNEWMFDEAWGVDVAVSTPRLMTALVEEAVSVGDLVRIFQFQQGHATMVGMTLPRRLAVRRDPGRRRGVAGGHGAAIVCLTSTVLLKDKRPVFGPAFWPAFWPALSLGGSAGTGAVPRPDTLCVLTRGVKARPVSGARRKAGCTTGTSAERVRNNWK